MDTKNENFIKTVGICAAGLAVGVFFPTVASIGLGAAAIMIYKDAPHSKENFLKLGAAVVCGVLAGPSIVGVAALAGYGGLAYNLLKQKGQSFYGKSYDKELIADVSTKVKRMFSSK